MKSESGRKFRAKQRPRAVLIALQMNQEFRPPFVRRRRIEYHLRVNIRPLFLLLVINVACSSAPPSQCPCASGAPPTAPTAPTVPIATAAPLPDRLSRDEISTVVVEKSGQIKTHCWNAALRKADPLPSEPVRLTMTLKISPDGTVGNLQHGGDPAGLSGLVACVAQEIRAWQFPQATLDTHVNIPFRFSVDPKASKASTEARQE